MDDAKAPEEDRITLAFEFGCLPPIQNEDLMLDQIEKRNRFWNRLVEIEREYRGKVREIITPPNCILGKLEDELTLVREEIDTQYKFSMKQFDKYELRNKVNELIARLKEERRIIKEQKKQLIMLHKDQLDLLELKRREIVRQARAESGLYWGNYDEIFSSYQVARRKAMRNGRELQFHQFNGSGKVTIRYQNGLKALLAFGTDTRLQIDPIPEYAWTSPIRSVRRNASRSKIRIRIGSNGRKPIWLELPFIMHRPLPTNSVIRSASIIRSKLGNKFTYKLLITLVVEAANENPDKTCSVGINVDWHKVNGGLRVACWHDSEGKSGEVILPDSLVSQFTQINNLKSLRTKHFNSASNLLKTWLSGKTIPEWLKSLMDNLSSPGRLTNIVKLWRSNRFPGDQEMVAYLEKWTKRDIHLWSWEFNLRDQIIKHRREIYRIFAAHISNNYRAVYLAKFNLNSINSPAKNGISSRSSSKVQKVIASISSLRQILRASCLKNGTDIKFVDYGHAADPNAAKEILEVGLSTTYHDLKQ